MNLQNLPKSVCAVVLCTLPIFAGANSLETDNDKRQPSSEVRAKLFRQLLADYEGLLECELREGGIRAAEENMHVEEIDLNRDGVKEYQMELSGCGSGEHNSSLYIYRPTSQGFEQILDSSGLRLELLKTFSNGYADLRVGARYNLAVESQATYKFDGKEYSQSGTILVNLETGESKPGYRRVQFKRGSLSTTVTGRASLAMPDTLLVGARAGQVMTVRVTTGSKEVKFFVMTSTTTLLTGKSRNWTGTLPESGDYHIFVDGDEDSSPYSITITVK